jgi:TIR domain/Prenyltransferase and squalene oxidase repeat
MLLPDATHDLYVSLSGIVGRASAELARRLEPASGFAYVRSEVDGGPGVWETADVIRMVDWDHLPLPVREDALGRWLLTAQDADGGFPPWPDISSRRAYTESTARCCLSLLRMVDRIPSLRPELISAATRAGRWLIAAQDKSTGGWGSYAGWSSRTSPTAWSIISLHYLAPMVAGDLPLEIAGAIGQGREWLHDTQQPDGGYGLIPDAPSNICSTSQAAWALSVIPAPIDPRHTAWLIAEVDRTAELEDVTDPISEDPAAKLFGRFQLRLLGLPLATLGLMACRVEIGHPALRKLLMAIVAAQNVDGLWRIPDGRSIWPTHFYLWALRTWLRTYEDYARSGVYGLHHGANQAHYTIETTTTSEGCSLPDTPGRIGRHVFISHASADKHFSRSVSRVLRAAGWLTWFDEDIDAGSDLVTAINEGLGKAHTVLLLITDNFVDRRWLEFEVNTARRLQIEGVAPVNIVPIVIGVNRDRIPDAVRNLVWKTASDESEALALILEALRGGQV